MGGFGAKEETAYAELLVKLQAALTHARPAGKRIAIVSACVGDTKNGLVSPAGVQAAPPGSLQLVDMGTYTSSSVSFDAELLTALERIKLPHLTVGLSASTDSWKRGAPTAAQLQARFSPLHRAGVTRLALFGTEFFEEYAPFLRAFLHHPPQP